MMLNSGAIEMFGGVCTWKFKNLRFQAPHQYETITETDGLTTIPQVNLKKNIYIYQRVM